jgi:type IV secretion system protein VirB9
MIKSTLLASAAITLALSATAYAEQMPVPSRYDKRIGELIYRPNDVFKIWSAPGAVMSIQFSDDETIDAATGAHTCPPNYQPPAADKPETECGFSAQPRGNFLYLKFRRCLIPQMLLVGTKTAAGKMRSYAFEVHTEPEICGDDAAPKPDSGVKLVSSANAAAAPSDIGVGDLKYISTTALTQHAAEPVHYSIQFRYPGDEAEKRHESASARRKREEKVAVDAALSREVDFATRDPFSGNRHVRYFSRGSATITPRSCWDNGYLTACTFPDLQRMPSVYRLAKPEQGCTPDGKEGTANYSVRGDTMILTGTEHSWCLRDGDNVVQIWNMDYSPLGSTPGTGTASPNVERVVRGASN